ncbi:deleted in malignant brain tumors 1 protein-like [Pomacea canaliculata]|uniref:deleted in malignant brain tumors 1 protein-like n=1 Tax=Pomacea canaliculata TaxID=400727 RepID=UPI000D72F3DB|nr:deleted in malignant brain tumors 1 protein-like [Pomacea canaliculata]
MALVKLLFVTATIWLTQISPIRSSYNRASVCGTLPLFPRVGRVYSMTSPNYPSSYYNNANCRRVINAPSGYVVKVTVRNAMMEQGHDYVQLFDGPSEARPSLARFSSMPSPTVYYTSGQSMYIKFFTDRSVVSSGFRLTYEVVRQLSVPSSVCSVNPPTLFANPRQVGFLTSPNYPSQYGNNINCRRVIAAPAGYVIKVTILNLSLELNYDYVDLLDGISDSCSRLGRFYSMPSVRVYFSSGRYMSIRFFTDGSVTNSGFRLKYKAIPASGSRG